MSEDRHVARRVCLFRSSVPSPPRRPEIRSCQPNYIKMLLSRRSYHFSRHSTSFCFFSSSMSTAARACPKAPRLPIPDLHKTLQKYLRSIVPVLQDKEARGGTPFSVAYEQRVRWANEFEHDLGVVCQQRLHGTPFFKRKYRLLRPYNLIFLS